MARRKRPFMDDGDSSGSDSDGADASETSLVDGDEYGRRMSRRKSKARGKEDAIYGVFGSGDEGENERQGGIGRTVRGRNGKGHRVDYLRGQAFVAASSTAKHKMDEDEDGPLERTRSTSVGTSDGDSEDMRVSGSIQDDEDDEDDEDQDIIQPAKEVAEHSPTAGLGHRAGIGSGLQNAGMTVPPQKSKMGNSAFAQMFTRGAIGSSAPASEEAEVFKDGPPDARAGPVFAKATSGAGLQPAVVPPSFEKASPDVGRDATQQQESIPQVPKVSFTARRGAAGKFDPSRYLAAMGWSGGGLGKQGEGIVNPIEVKQRPERAGIAFGGLKEKTKQAKAEARRRGEAVSSDEEDRKKDSKHNKPRVSRAQKDKTAEQAWTKAEKKPRKPKIEHRTYEEILEQHGHSSGSAANVGPIVDAAGNEYTSISAALARHSVPSTEPKQLIELTHNLQIICTANSTALDALAKEGAHIIEQHKWLQRDRDESLRRRAKAVAESAQLAKVVGLVEALELQGRRSQNDASVTLSDFEQPTSALLEACNRNVADRGIDEAVVASILPVFRREMSVWQPLQEPKRLIGGLEKIKPALQADKTAGVMTPYESMLWNIWMPPVRSALNNDWDLQQPLPVIELLQAWTPVLPAFIRDNVTQQLILPRLQMAVSDWDGKRSLYKIVFPWMPILSKQLDDVLAEAKRRLRGFMKTWRVPQGPPKELKYWRDALSRKEWDSMLLHHVVDKLSSHLQRHLRINPQAQDLEPLEQLLAWRTLLAPKIMSKLLLSRFLPAWLDTLHRWMMSSHVNFEDVAAWYEHWKQWFQSHDAYTIDSVQSGFGLALELMDAAIGLGEDRSGLAPPDLKRLQTRHHGEDFHQSDDHSKRKSPGFKTAFSTETDNAVTFRQIIDDAAAEADLLVMSLNRTEIASGMPLLRISRSIDGRGGTTFYIEGDVAFAEQKDSDSSRVRYMPTSVHDLVAAAK